ncbi:MAG: hypothetical protein WCH65_07390 [bacterium]
MVDKDIAVIYRPREEKEENLRYKEERKKAEKEAEKMEKGMENTDEDADIESPVQPNIFEEVAE